METKKNYISPVSDLKLLPKLRRWHRTLEILPGALGWSALILPLILSFIIPGAVATFILCFDIYWLYKALIIGYHLIQGYRSLKREIRIDWLGKCRALKVEGTTIDWRGIYNAIILATYKEEIETLRASIQSAAAADFPQKRIIFVLATEERDKLRARQYGEILAKEFGKHFFAFLVTEHPDHIAGEVKAKGANVTWAAKQLRKFLDGKKINYDNVIVTTADADSRFHPKYFACLTYNYVINPNRDFSSYQPIPLYSNNIWEAPALSRILAFSSSFWQLVEATRPWRLVNFSTHAMSMKTLIEINYWYTTVVNEDSGQFWRAYFAYDGNHQVVPMFIPVYMDAVLSENFWQTLKSLYQQRRRWAYGVEHFSPVVLQSIQNKAVPFLSKAVKVWRLFEGNFTWATASLFIGFVAWWPIWFGGEFKNTVLGYNFPVVARFLLILAWLGLFISASISTLLLPPRPPKYKKAKFLEMLAQWVLVPIQAIFFSSFPALDAQTRLMLGRYLTFQVTTKKSAKGELGLETVKS